VTRAAVAKDLVVSQTRVLKMPGLARVFEGLARQAREEHWGYEEYLHDALAAEIVSRRVLTRPLPERLAARIAPAG